MDDYNTSMLSEAKNEYCSRLLIILAPLLIEGLKSILKEADTLCIDNDEEEKYLMTFQNFLSRVPRWNSDMIEEETNRIISKSGCNYLEDLLTCVHITQLKVLTSIRVGSKQKKIDLDIPKLQNFIHKIYIKFARKVYKNVYLFEKNIQPLVYQKNMRECENICKECILEVIRDSIPVEKILRSYIDESVEEEIVEEVKETLEMDPSNNEKSTEEAEKAEKEVKDSKEIKDVKEIKVKKENNEDTHISAPPDEEKKTNEGAIKVETPVFDKKEEKVAEKSSSSSLSFNNTDTLFDPKTNKKEEKYAPKTLDRLEEISKVANQKRKEEEASYDDDDDEKIKIFNDGPKLKLDTFDVHDLEKELKLKPNIKNDIEFLT